MEAVDLRHRRGGEPIGVLVAKVGLFHEGKLREVRKRHEVAGLHAFLVATAAEEGDMFVFVGNEFLQFPELHLSQLRDRHVVGF